MQTALVTGGAGFLGSHLVEELLHLGYRVISLDNGSTSNGDNLVSDVTRWASRSDNGHVQHFWALSGDVTKPIAPQFLYDVRSLGGKRIDVVYHLASAVSPSYCDARPLQVIDVIVNGTLNALKLAKQMDARFVLASSSEIYGDAQLVPTPESYTGNVSPVGPRAPYAEGKRLAETLTEFHRRLELVDAGIARIFNCYGPRMRPGDGRVVPAFFEAIRDGRPIVLHGDGRSTRSFCYASDTARGLIALAESGLAGPVNIGSGQEVSMLELAEQVYRIIDQEPQFEHVNGTGSYSDDTQRRCPDLRIARRELGWEPRLTLESGLRRVARHYGFDVELLG
ncbi:MAG TPA: NAD-dependent epimerase/dehydratase family protein [Gaiellaceae bacterium]|jgi:dTDP-glucose 4,6-dehydratase|nr:NAD-dependent epimerase/dehydratase family protein [Gaiellaceae bacterium]